MNITKLRTSGVSIDAPGTTMSEDEEHITGKLHRLLSTTAVM